MKRRTNKGIQVKCSQSSETECKTSCWKSYIHYVSMFPLTEYPEEDSHLLNNLELMINFKLNSWNAVNKNVHIQAVRML